MPDGFAHSLSISQPVTLNTVSYNSCLYDAWISFTVFTLLEFQMVPVSNWPPRVHADEWLALA
jgi:hypothetical protein